MAIDPENGNRVTVALVAEMVKGLQELTRTEFREVQRQLDMLVSLPQEITKLTRDGAALERRVTLIEKQIAVRADREEERREEERRERQAARRWLIGVGITIVVALISAGAVLLAAHP